MGNYNNLELEFIERTIRLIGQYTDMIDGLEFEDQLNYTLTINCLLGLIVMPKEKAFTYIPKKPITIEFLNTIGLKDSRIDGSIKNLQELIKYLRNAIAHFDIEVISLCDKKLVDFIEFKGHGKQPEIIARFSAPEIYPFLKYYGKELCDNLKKHHA